MASTRIVPITTTKNGSKTVITTHEVDERTLKDLKITEADLEEFVRTNISALFPDIEETLLVVGQQVRNEAAGRADLVAIDGRGNIVLIELKRDHKDITPRKEPFEFQAIRYAANYARIKTQPDIVERLFAPYIEKHKEDDWFKLELEKGLTTTELAARLLRDFLDANKAQDTVNRTQRIVLVAASFDQETLSACAWLASKGIDIRCITISPMHYKQHDFFRIEQVIPPPSLEGFFVEIPSTTKNGKPVMDNLNLTKQVLPRMSKLFDWNLLQKGDQLYNRVDPEHKAIVIDDKYVEFNGKKIEYNKWGQEVTGWSSINIYEWTVHEPTGKTLDQLRREKMDELAQEEALSSSTEADQPP